MKKTLVVITGPTAVGKTALCMDIARHYGIPIINADSRQIYRGMKIGTAAPTAEQQREVKHYFTGSLDLADYYNASMYEQEVARLLPRLFAESRDGMALLSGGSMMYIDSVCNGIDDMPTISDETRTMMKRRMAEEGFERLCEELRLLDPEYYALVDRKNPRRVIHGLEICYQTGKTYTHFRKREKKPRPFDNIVKIALNRPREDKQEGGRHDGRRARRRGKGTLPPQRTELAEHGGLQGNVRIHRRQLHLGRGRGTHKGQHEAVRAQAAYMVQA